MSYELLVDLALLILLAASVVLIYRLRPDSSLLAGPPRRWALRSRYPALARQAGYSPERARWIYWLAKVALAAGLPLAWLEIWPANLSGSAFWIVFLALLGLFLPDGWLLWRRRLRQRRIQRALSFFLDLLVALLHAGLTIEEAFRRSAREGLDRSHPLAREAALVARELDAGRDRADAFRALGERTGVPELKAVVAALRLAIRHGTSVEKALENQAELLRTKRRENARRQVTVAATKAVFPLFLCGFPIFFVLVFFPTLLELVEAFRALASLF